MIRYSWKKLYKITGRSSKSIFYAFKAHYTKQAKNEFDPRYKYLHYDFSGDSYLLNPYTLYAEYYKYSIKNIAEYIILASYRSYSNYKIFGDKTLDVALAPKISNNPLLTIKNNKIHFYYE